MNYHLTEHARDALAKRRIPLEWMEKDPIDEDLEYRLARIAEFGDRVLRVIANIKAVPPRIVTCHFDRRRTGP